MKKGFVLFLVFSLFTVISSQAQGNENSSKTVNNSYAGYKALVKSGTYQFEGEFVFNGRNRSALDNTSNVITIMKKKIVEGSLQSLNKKDHALKSKVSKYNVDFNDNKKTIVISFNADGNTISIEIKPNGRAFLTYKTSGETITQRGKLIRV